MCWITGKTSGACFGGLETLSLGSAAADGCSRAQCFRALVASERALRHSMPATKCLRKSKVGAGTVLSVDQAKRALWLQDLL